MPASRVLDRRRYATPSKQGPPGLRVNIEGGRAAEKKWGSHCPHPLPKNIKQFTILCIFRPPRLTAGERKFLTLINFFVQIKASGVIMCI